MNEERREELAALQALGIQDEAGQKELRDAQAQDGAADKLTRDFNETVAALAYTAPQRVPPSRLKKEILGQLPKQIAEPKIINFPQWIPFAVAAVLMALGIVQAWRMVQLKSEIAGTRQSLAQVQAQNAELQKRPSLAELRVVPLQSRDPAYAMVSVAVAWNQSSTEGLLAVQSLPEPPVGHDYQLWVLDPKKVAPISAGLVKVTATDRYFNVGAVSTSSPGFAISLEPSGGMPAPTGPILFATAPVN